MASSWFKVLLLSIKRKLKIAKIPKIGLTLHHRQKRNHVYCFSLDVGAVQTSEVIPGSLQYDKNTFQGFEINITTWYNFFVKSSTGIKARSIKSRSARTTD